jgi:hypothetical protein
MSSCACRRWGPGTTCEKPVDTPGARELEAKMNAIMAEREKQANFWGGTAAPLKVPIIKPFCEFNIDKTAPEYTQEPRQCDLNQRSNLSNSPAPTSNQQTTLSNSAFQQMRFWN